LKMAAPGDLLLLFADAISRSWKQVVYFKADHPTPTAASPVRSEPATTDRDSTRGALIQDERGVRIARDSDD